MSHVVAAPAGPNAEKNSSGTNTPGHVENMLGQKNDSPPLDIMKQHLPNLFGQVQNDVFLCWTCSGRWLHRLEYSYWLGETTYINILEITFCQSTSNCWSGCLKPPNSFSSYMCRFLGNMPMDCCRKWDIACVVSNSLPLWAMEEIPLSHPIFSGWWIGIPWYTYHSLWQSPINTTSTR